ncbi:hypothetical protein [Bosea caraganae]|uniref:hypothetical protein n=1 Tax=Bosea caraganae TaxID=2763117 RepID=UPI0015F01CDE|nr:hypothetical protein [Bosea caraganae]
MRFVVKQKYSPVLNFSKLKKKASVVDVDIQLYYKGSRAARRRLRMPAGRHFGRAQG